MVGLGSAVFMIMSEIVAKSVMFDGLGAKIITDPGRIAAQVVTGIGFLGAGTIIKEGISVRGLTTAACLWVAAAVGLAAGAGEFDIAIAGTFIALISLISLYYFERAYTKDSYRILTVTTDINVEISSITEAVSSKTVQVVFMELERNYKNNLTTVKLHVKLFHKGLTDRLAHGIIKSLEKAGIILHTVKWERS
jgi:putative Mg2+ transporter-C (MgtC) family protein